MKRFHVHVAVDDLNANIRFYSAVFGAEPSVRKPDYAKWMLENPRARWDACGWHSCHRSDAGFCL